MSDFPIPRTFFWRRIHSLVGLWLVIYIILHLLTNSQAALLIGDDGEGFISSVNSIHKLPYLPLLELLVIALPFLIHACWGISYLRTSKMNSFKSDGSTPSLEGYSRNRAYSWQRITSWILLVGIIAHVIHMRVIEYPSSAQVGSQRYYIVRLQDDAGLATLAKRLDVKLINSQQVPQLSQPSEEANQAVLQQEKNQSSHLSQVLQAANLQKHQVAAVAKDFGTAELLMVRETFKSPIMIVLYSFFVIAACYHAFNGLWTFLFKWGVTLTERSRVIYLRVCLFLMVIVTFLGLAAAWGTYWINLRY